MHHSRGLRFALSKDKYDQNQIDAILKELEQHEFSSENFSTQNKAMLQYAAKLSELPEKMNGDDVQELRSVGFDDRSIHDIACIVGYFAFVNRVADGLGVELED